MSCVVLTPSRTFTDPFPPFYVLLRWLDRSDHRQPAAVQLPRCVLLLFSIPVARLADSSFLFFLFSSDGMMIIFALLATNFLHPGFLLDTRNNSISLGMKRKKAPKVDA